MNKLKGLLKKFGALLFAFVFVLSLVGARPAELLAASTSQPSVGRCTTTSSNLNIRSSASTSSSIVASLPSNAYIEVIGSSGNFYKVYYNTSSNIGYCSKSYISIVSTTFGQVKTNSGNLNLRSSASTSSTIVASIPNGTILPVISSTSGWYRVVWGTTVGYVSGSYFSTTVDDGGNTSATRTQLVDYAKTLQGIYYQWGGNCIYNSNDYGLDCSHFTYSVLKKYGLMSSYKTSSNQASWCTSISKSSLQPGDLVFYKNSSGTVVHVTMYIGNNQVIGASGGDSSTTTLAKAKAANAKVKITSLDSDRRTKTYGRVPGMN